MKEECESLYEAILNVPTDVFYNKDEDGDTELMKVVFPPHFSWNLLYAMMGRIVRDMKQDYINLKNKRQQSVLYAAVSTNNLLLCAWLVEDLGADVTQTCNIRGDTLLHALARWGDPYIDITRYLLERSNVDSMEHTNIHGETPLCAAVISKHETVDRSKTIQELVRKGANIAYQWRLVSENTVMTPLHYAVQHYEENPQLISSLLDSTSCAADLVNSPLSPHDSSTLLHAAVYYTRQPQAKYNLLQYLLSKGADKHAQDYLGLYPVDWCHPASVDICGLLRLV